MKLRMGAIAVSACCLLLGCKADVLMPVSLNEIQGTGVVKTAKLYAEVPSCQDRKTKLESSHVLQAKQQVPYVLKGAEFCRCFDQGFNSYVEFDVPITAGGADGGSPSPDQINVTSYKNGDTFIYVGQTIRQQFSQLSKDSNRLTPRLALALTNNSDRDIKVFLPSAYVAPRGSSNGTPVHEGEITHPKDAEYTYTLSNSGVEFAMQQGFVKLMVIK